MANAGFFCKSSDQEGTEIAKELRLAEKCDAGKTYCFEIVYPANKILVDYGKRRELVLLAVIDTEFGFDEPNSTLAAIAQDLGVRVA